MQPIGQHRGVSLSLDKLMEWRYAWPLRARGHGGARWYHRRPMIFVDYLGPAERFAEVREVVRREVGAALRVPPEQVVVRRIVTDADRDEVELWIELSSDEQLYRLGRPIAQGVSGGLRPDGEGPEVWVMFRVVPLSHAFLNGMPRARGAPSFD